MREFLTSVAIATVMMVLIVITAGGSAILGWFGHNKDGFLVVGGFITLGLVWYRGYAINKSANSAARQVNVSEQGIITERYVRSIEQLGSEKSEIRLGAIYGLENIAVESKSYYEQVIEVLSAFIRSNSTNTECESYANGKKIIIRYAPMIDVQAALTVLGRLPEYSDKKDLSGAFLAEYKFRGNYKGANLQDAKLYGANLRSADLEYVNLYNAKLQSAKLQGANLTRANLRMADLCGATLNGAWLHRTKLHGANLQRVKLHSTKVHRTHLHSVDLRGATLHGSEFSLPLNTLSSILRAPLTPDQIQQAVFNSDGLDSKK